MFRITSRVLWQADGEHHGSIASSACPAHIPCPWLQLQNHFFNDDNQGIAECLDEPGVNRIDFTITAYPSHESVFVPISSFARQSVHQHASFHNSSWTACLQTCPWGQSVMILAALLPCQLLQRRESHQQASPRIRRTPTPQVLPVLQTQPRIPSEHNQRSFLVMSIINIQHPMGTSCCRHLFRC